MAEVAAEAQAPAPPPAPADPLAPVQAALDRLEADLATARDAAPTLEAALADTDAVPVLLAAMVAEDQALDHAADGSPDPAWGLDLRLAWVSRVEDRAATAAAAHAAALGALLDRYGWPGIGRFGAAADQDAWILAQHADLDPDLQDRALLLLEDAVDDGDSDPARFAYLFDRIQVRRGRAQRYGTQGRCEEGRWQPYPLELPEHVDRLRADVGLGTLAAFQAQVAETCR